MPEDEVAVIAYYNGQVGTNGLPLCSFDGHIPCSRLRTDGTYAIMAARTGDGHEVWKDLQALAVRINDEFARGVAALLPKAQTHFDDPNVEVRMLVDDDGFHLTYATCEGKPVSYGLLDAIKAGREKLDQETDDSA